MSRAGKILGVVIGIFVAVVLFFMILPGLAERTGAFNTAYTYALGFFVIIGLLVALVKR